MQHALVAAWTCITFPQDCIRVLGLLASEACPVREAALQQHLAKLLAYIKKYMQVQALVPAQTILAPWIVFELFMWRSGC